MHVIPLKFGMEIQTSQDLHILSQAVQVQGVSHWRRYCEIVAMAKI